MRTKKAQLAECILDAASRLFAKRQFHQVRMDSIAAEAKVSKSTLYSRFKDKKALYAALLDRGSRDVIKAMEDAVASHSAPRGKLVALVNALLDYFDARPHLFDLIQGVELMRGPPAGFPWQHARDVGVRLVHQVFREGRETGEFVVADPELAALLLFGGLRAIIRFGKRPHPRPRRLAQQLVDVVLFGAASK